MILTSFILLLSITTTVSAQNVVSGKIEPEQIEIGKQGKIVITFNIPAGFHQSLQKEYFFIEPADIEGIIFKSTFYPEGVDEDGVITYYHKVTLTRLFTIDKHFEPGSYKIKIIAGYQFCDDTGMCHLPEEVELVLPITIGDATKPKDVAPIKDSVPTKPSFTEQDFSDIEKLLDDFVIAGVTGGYQKSNEFIAFLDQTKSSNDFITNTFVGKSIWLVVLLILIGGIALNLTPCVLPMIPITIAVLGAGTQAESKGRGLLIGGTYGLGMTLAYGTLGVIVVLTGSKFGAINASPWFNIIIAVIFVFLALAMFDIIHVDFSKFRSGNIQEKNKGKFITVFVLGVIAAVLAGACIAPVLISVILYSTTLYAKGNSAGLLLPFLLGAGMAIPWPFAGAGLSFLPKPGKWMDWVKYIFGVIIFVIAIYYGYTGVKIFQNRVKSVEQIEVAEEISSLPWIYSLPDGLENAKQEGKPVMIDFWATWCKNCLVMDATTFKDDEVIAKLEDYVLVKYKAENLKESPTKEILDYFGVLGLPTYVILVPK